MTQSDYILEGSAEHRELHRKTRNDMMQHMLAHFSKEVMLLTQERDHYRSMLLTLGFCPDDGETMPCTRCGAGL